MTLRETHHPLVVVPGLRGHVDDHWQTRLAARLPGARSSLHPAFPWSEPQRDVRWLPHLPHQSDQIVV